MERDQASKFVNDLLRLMVSRNGSDLFLTADFPPAIKVDGKVTKVSPQPLTGQHTLQLARSVMNDKQAADFERTKECNFAISPQGIGRFRVNAFMQQGHVGMLDAQLQHRPAGRQLDGCLRLARSRLGAGSDLDQRLAQQLELRVLGMQSAQIATRRLQPGHRLKHNFGIAQGQLLIEVAADLQRLKTAAAGIARIFQNGEIELELGKCLRVRRPRQRGREWQFESRHIKTPLARFLDLEQSGLSLRREAHIRDP